MRIAHKKLDTKDTPGSWLDKAKDFEKQDEPENAAAAYEKVIRERPLDEYAYDRLMIIYRKNKDYKKEKIVIGKAIKAFEQFYKNASKTSASTKIISLSKAFMKSTGLADKKGKLLYQKEPLARWNKRKSVVEKRLKA
jgi:tetratricopeptide (TPR) repeat protein